jgi:thiamine kinase-like enzyme
MQKEFSLRDNSEKLFNILKQQYKDLVLKEDSSHVRNVVRKADYQGVNSYVKIGFADNMKNLFAFTNNQLSPQSFHLPEYLLKGEFTHSDIQFSYIVIKEVPGASLYNSKKFELLSSRVVDIVNEILEFPDLNLPRTEEHKKVLSNQKGKTEYKEQITKRLSKYFENSKYQYQKVFDRAKELLSILIDSDKYQLGTVHGELNFHHIFTDDNDNIWIIDWERISQAYPYYYDLAEYIARLMVSVEYGIELAKTTIGTIKIKDNAHLDTFKFCLYHRLLGTIWEKSDREEDLFIDDSDGKEILNIVESIEVG